MSNEINDLPSWEPGRVLDELARTSGRSRGRLDAELRDLAHQVSDGEHLNFEQMQRAAFSTEEQQHLDACLLCQRLHASLHPSDEIFARMRRKLGEALEESPLPAQETSAAPALRRLQKKEEEAAAFDWWRLVGVAASVATAVVGVFAVQQHQAAAPLTTLSTDSQFSVAQTLVKEGQYPQANKILLKALEGGGIEQGTLYTVGEVLQAQPVGRPRHMGALREMRQALNPAQHTDNKQAVALVQLSTRQMQGGQWIEGYESLAAYLQAVEPQAPATEAFQRKFVAQLLLPTSVSASENMAEPASSR